MAWSARGSRPARDVPDSGFKLFNDGLLAAERALMSARPTLRATAIWQNMLLAVVLDSRQSKQNAGQIFTDGVRQWPGYYDFYELVLTRLVPSWGGSWDTVDQFITSWADRLRATEGDSVYARFYSSVVLDGYSPYATKINWGDVPNSVAGLSRWS